MAFMEKFNVLKDTVTTKGKEVAQKAKDMADIASINSQIKNEQEAVTRALADIGQQVFDIEKDKEDTPYQKQIAAILKAQINIAKLEEEIAEIKGFKKCPNCGKDMPFENSHCGSCGAEYTAPEIPEAPSVCPSCGGPIAQDDTMCVQCGRTL